MTTDEICADVAADITGMIGPVYRVTPAPAASVTVRIDHWSGEYRLMGERDGTVRVAGPALVGYVPASHVHPIGDQR